MSLLFCTSPVWIGFFLAIAVSLSIKHTRIGLSRKNVILAIVISGLAVAILNGLWWLLYHMSSYQYIFDFWAMWLVIFLVFLVLIMLPIDSLQRLSKRQGVVIGIAILMGLVGFLRLPYTLAKIEVENTITNLGFLELGIDIDDSNRYEVYREVWLRDMVPPPKEGCFSDNQEVCRLGDFIEDYPDSRDAVSNPSSYESGSNSMLENLLTWLLSFLGRWLVLGLLLSLWLYWFVNNLIQYRLRTS